MCVICFGVTASSITAETYFTLIDSSRERLQSEFSATSTPSDNSEAFFWSNPASCFHMFTALIHASLWQSSWEMKRIKMQQAEATLQHLSQNEIKRNWNVIKKKNHIKGANSFLAPVLEQRWSSRSLASFCSPHAEMVRWAVARGTLHV